MPIRAKRGCAKQGCTELVDTGYCDIHKKACEYEYDKHRGSSTDRGYDSKWRSARLGWLKKHPLCRHCNDKGLVVGATVVDHIIDHKGDKTLFWDRNNWQSLCKSCHDRKTALTNRWGRGYGGSKS